MEIKLCLDKGEWDIWFKKHAQNEFLQSWDWGEFQASTGKSAVRLQAVEKGEVIWQVQGFEHKLGGGLPAVALAKAGMKYLYVPRASFKLTALSYKFLKDMGFSFIRVEPTESLQLTAYSLQLTKNRQPRTTLILDLSQLEEALLANMHSKTRYNISLAERKEVEVKNEKDVNVFWILNQATTERDKFKSHGKEYYAKMLQYDFTHQLTAYYNNIPIAAILLIMFGDTCVYLHGASSNEERNLMAPYLLQWRGIQLAKKLGCKYYDFWGIAPASTAVGRQGGPAPKANEPSSCFHNLCWEVGHRWTGVTRFKAGFGGEAREYPEAVDVVLKKWQYSLYKLARKLL